MAIRSDEVFGVNDSINVRSHITRDVEAQIADCLASPTRNIIVLYGSSKEGKTSLARMVLQSGRHLKVWGHSDFNRNDFLANLISEARKLAPDFGSEALQSRASGQPINIQQLAEEYKKSPVFQHVPILIDNFHYLDDESGSADVQRQVAQDLRILGQEGVKLLILGTWRTPRYIQSKLNDLDDRISSFPVEPWTEGDLRAVIQKGSNQLNIKILPAIVNDIILHSESSIGILQSIVYNVVVDHGVKKRQNVPKLLDKSEILNASITSISQSFMMRLGTLMRDLSSVGKAWHGDPRRSRAHWIIQAYLSGTEQQITTGFPLMDLFEATTREIEAQTGQPVQMLIGEFSKIVKHDLVQKQKARGGTVVLGYDDESGSLIVLNRQILYALRRGRSDIKRELSRRV